MKGIEIAENYYYEFGKPMLEKEFQRLLPYIAAGFVGSGSDRYGFDDEISRDHDFEPGFCIFIPGEDAVSRRDAFLLERAYAKLPKEYFGIRRQVQAPVGGRRNGVIRISDFYTLHTGSPDGDLSLEAWLTIPDSALFEATDGKVFEDHYGEFSRIRAGLLQMPRDIKLKRIAGNLLIMAQSGQYNFPRCIKRSEPEAAQLAAVEFVNSALKTIFLLNGKYLPYYKWSFRALRELEGCGPVASDLSLILTGSSGEAKIRAIESASAYVSAALAGCGILSAPEIDMERAAYAVNDTISDSRIRNLSIFAGV